MKPRSSCFSANFALICPNGIGFVMDRHGVSGEITEDHRCGENMLDFLLQISFRDTVGTPRICGSKGICPIWTGEQGSIAKNLREHKTKFEDQGNRTTVTLDCNKMSYNSFQCTRDKSFS